MPRREKRHESVVATQEKSHPRADMKAPRPLAGSTMPQLFPRFRTETASALPKGKQGISKRSL